MASEVKIRSWCAIIDYGMIVRNSIAAVESEISRSFLDIPVRERVILMRAVRRLVDKQIMATLARKAKIMMEGMDAALADELVTIAIVLGEVNITGMANEVLCRIIKTHVENAVDREFYRFMSSAYTPS